MTEGAGEDVAALPAAAPRTTPVQPSAVLTFGELLRTIKDNFALVSAVALLIGVTLATTFLAAYLSVFDWHLLWFIQYPDVITFGLLALGILSSSATLFQGFSQGILAGKTPAQRRNGFIIVALLMIAGTALNIFDAVHAGKPYFHILSGTSAFFIAIVLILVVASHFQASRLPSPIQWVLLLLLFVTGSGALGRWIGESVDETAEFNQDVYTKDQALTDVKIVIVMSRHTVLQKGKVLYVLPTADISKFQTADKK